MPDDPPKLPLEKWLSQLGLDSSFAQKVRFRGPVGKIALLGVVCLACLGVLSYRASTPIIEGMCVVAAILDLLSTGGAILWYSHQHPNEATLEGMEVVIYQQQRAWAAKGLTENHASTSVIPNPESLPPQLNPSVEAEEA